MAKNVDKAAIARVDKEIRDHPERFDYADLPSKEGSADFAAYNKQMDARMPEWAKKMIADAQGRR